MNSYCRHRGPMTIVRTRIADGSWQVRSKCNECGNLFEKPLNQDYLDMASLPEYSQECRNPQCVVCGNLDTQLHHWFPQSLARKLNINPDMWPTCYLCSQCHDLWHRIVTPGLTKKITNGQRRKWEAPHP